MRKLLIVLSFLLLCPISVWANCNNTGATVVFINGLFGTKESADIDRAKLRENFQLNHPAENVKFITGFNESHLGGSDDLAQAIIQAYGYESLDYDLTTILNQIHDEVSTKKILLVGYSQGSFYANAIYKYLIRHGVNEESIAVYNVGTPASYVAGGGKYITSSTDKVINDTVRKLAQRSYARVPLPANVDINLDGQENSDTNGGHGFSSVYLKYESERIITEIDEALDKLRASGSQEKECFRAPGESLAYKIKKVAKNFTDNSINGIKNADPNDFVAGDFPSIISRIFGSNEKLDEIPCIYGPTLAKNDTPTESFFIDTEESTGRVLGIATEVLQEYAPDGISQTANISLQDILDDIAERIDIIAQQIRDLQPEPEEENKQEKPKEIAEEEDDGSDQEDETNNDTNNTPYQPGLGGGVEIIYPTVLISEIQVASETDEKEEFVELYNPNSSAVSLTGWYLQKKTATGQSYSSWASSTLFKDKTIPAKGYFLIARESYFASLADIFTTNSISSDNSFILKNPGGEISDKVGWGNAQDFETQATISPESGQTVGRIFLQAYDAEKDTQNNFADFEAQIPTPKAQNIADNSGGNKNGGDEGGEGDEEENNGGQEPEQATIVINEIQTAGADDEKQEFVELYNPTDKDVDLTGWYLQRKTAEGEDYISYASSTLFSGKTIGPESYFVIAREGYFADIADIFTTNPLADGNTLVLKRKDKSVADKVGWGAAQDYETAPAPEPAAGQTLDRKVAGQDTDNNFEDFVVRGEATPKESVFGLTIKDTSNYTNNFLPDNLKYIISLSWSSKINNVFYDVQYKFNNSDWQPWLNHTIGESNNFENAFYSVIEDKNVYSFRVKAFDSQGKSSEWKQINIDLSVPVVINEIGGQWIELYNRTDKAIDLTGWKLGQINLSGTISAKGYTVLESNPLPTGLLKLTKPNGQYVDSVSVDGPKERVSPWAYGQEAVNWLQEQSGTPAQQNTNYQLYTYLPLKVQRNLSLPEKLSPYYLNKNMAVLEGAGLAFDPGVIVKLANAGIISDGKITAIGSQQKPILFTSFKEATPADGDWFGINLTDKSYGSKFKYVEFKYGGGDLQQFGAALKASQNPIEVENCVFENNISRGLQLTNTASIIKNNKFFGINKSQSANIKPSAISVSSGADKIENNYFERNNVGISVADTADIMGNVSITGNDFKENKMPIYMWTLSHNAINNNVFTDNDYNTDNDANQIFLAARSLDNKHDAVLEAGQYYAEDIFVIPEGVKLTLQPGVQIGAQRGIDVRGELEAIGTATKQIIFRNGPMAGEVKPGKWGGLNFTASSQNSVMNNVEIYSAGNDLYWVAVKIDNTNVSIKNSFIHDNKNVGIKLVNSNSVVDNVKFYNHIETDSSGQKAKAIYVAGGSPEIKNSYFEKQGYAIYLDNGATSVLDNNTFIDTQVPGGDIFYAP